MDIHGSKIHKFYGSSWKLWIFFRKLRKLRKLNRRFGRASRPETQPVLETAPSTDRQEVLMLTIWEYNAKNNAKKLHCFSHYLTDPTILAYRITVSLGRKKSVQRKWHLGLSKHQGGTLSMRRTKGPLAPASRQCHGPIEPAGDDLAQTRL